jgi:kynureninase
MSGFAAHFSRFLTAVPGRLHVAAHSHHPWPDVSYDAHAQAWLDAAELMDGKWDRIFSHVVPEAQRHVAARLGLSDPAAIAFGPNTHSLLMRLLSCLPGRLRILTTEAEFHSFDRQVRRLEEEGRALVDRVPAEPFGSFAARLSEAAARGRHDLVFFSHVHFDSGYVTPDLAAVVGAVAGSDTFVVVDGYHGFMAIPTDLSAIESRAFYLAGGYKYAMAGEGACFLHCPPGWCPRPPDTGWFAGFGTLTDARAGGVVPYAADGSRFLGATFDPTPLYRFNAVQRWLDDLGVTVEAIHAHVGRLQGALLDRLDARTRAALVPGAGEVDERGHFLTFRLPDAGVLHQRLRAAGVITDHRDDRLRVGFGLYHGDADVEELCRRLAAVTDGAPGHRPRGSAAV